MLKGMSASSFSSLKLSLLAAFTAAGLLCGLAACANSFRRLSSARLACARCRLKRCQSSKPPPNSVNMPLPSKAITCVTVFSKNALSWLTRNSVPVKSCNRLSNSSKVSMSKSLVGSSNTNTLAGRANNRANSKRLRSPPDKDLTGERERCGGNKKSSK